MLVNSTFCIQLYNLICILLRIDYTNLLNSIFNNSLDIGFRIALSLDCWKCCLYSSATSHLEIIHLGRLIVVKLRIMIFPMWVVQSNVKALWCYGMNQFFTFSTKTINFLLVNLHNWLALWHHHELLELLFPFGGDNLNLYHRLPVRLKYKLVKRVFVTPIELFLSYS